MALIAIDQRAHLLTAAALLLIAVAPWHRAKPESSRVPLTVSIADAGAELGQSPAAGPLGIDIPGVDPIDLPNAAGSVVHPDMRPWPTGMVIGPRPSGDRNNLRRLGVWDSLLSALLAPFRSLSA